MVQKFGPLLLDIPSEPSLKENHCLNLTNHYYSYALKRMYLEKYFDNSMKLRVNALGQEIKYYFIDNINDLKFMDESTKHALLEKVKFYYFFKKYTL